jgi:hypothetical protein
MMKRLVLIPVLLFTLQLTAQVTGGVRPRPDDHFWRRKVLMRIDLKEKLNRPLTAREAPTYDGTNTPYTYRQGLVSAMVTAYEQGMIMGYHPDTLTQPLTWETAEASYRRLAGVRGVESSTLAGAVQLGVPTEAATDPEEAFFPEEEGSEWLEDPEAMGTETELQLTPEQLAMEAINFRQDMVAGLSGYLEVIEDRIYDRNRSDLYHDVQYIRLVYVDPEGALPDRPVVVFHYSDLQDLLASTQCRNTWNDAEARSMQEVFEGRTFRGFIVELSGNTSRTTNEAEVRRQQLVAFEHNLYQQ